MRASTRNGLSWPIVALLGVACLLIGGWVARRIPSVPAADSSPAEDPSQSSSTPVVVARGELAEHEQATIEVFEATKDAVVYITTLQRRRASPYSLNVLEQPRGTGSGFVWDSSGHVVTNFHVVADGDAFKVAMSDGEAYDAKLVGVDPSKDLAVLKIAAPQVKPLSVGRSGDLRVGQRVFAIGNPFGLDHTLTTGIVSALGREINAVNGRTIHDVIQTDAAINPGNSGGPLLDSAARLIGVNTAIFSPSGASSGIGFAVPVDTVRKVVPQLIEHGRVIRPSLGVMLLPDDRARRLQLPGPMISLVVPGGPADKAGLHGLREGFLGRVALGDIITAVDGRRVRNGDALFGLLEERKIGDSVVLRVLRDRTELEVRVTLSRME
jgi:S1-C subfamily serine protease